jgi:hypothetical protein
MFIKTVNPVPPFNNEVHERACHLEARDEQVFLTARDTHGQTDRQASGTKCLQNFLSVSTLSFIPHKTSTT